MLEIPDPADAPKRSVSILGSTGSIGCNTIDLIERHRDAYDVEALTCHRNVDIVAEQARKLQPKFVAVCDETQYPALKDALGGTGIEIAAGREAVIEAAARPADWVMAAIVGAAGLRPTLAAVRRGAMVALANKEMPGLRRRADDGGGRAPRCDVAAGRFRAQRDLPGVRSRPAGTRRKHHPDRVGRSVPQPARPPRWRKSTPAQAVAHPNWSMGAKISVDSATMMNKGLELIEARHLFPVGAENGSTILVHPQSVVHSMVAYVDGSVLAQLGTPDMRTPIAYTLGWPERISTPSAPSRPR